MTQTICAHHQAPLYVHVTESAGYSTVSRRQTICNGDGDLFDSFHSRGWLIFINDLMLYNKIGFW